jgi:hypothetical protein
MEDAMGAATRQANFILPEDLFDELRRTVPKGEQSRVVAEALKNELTRIRLLQESFGAWKRSRHPELAKGSRRYVGSVRKSSRRNRIVGQEVLDRLAARGVIQRGVGKPGRSRRVKTAKGSRQVSDLVVEGRR